ncbi:uncharacterized protein EI90DRAFT_451017 [Cantharellus anzutake]|uniref:uncharacterized protein n=1 Tax=Cantharellus anzutake TaxID=1750568 RepID=UPI001904B6DE|nr:uncharacterized protein EI90DRAFT_451017 [Cantharellus anzutake]KAF8334668.1 hypothetical protein EI90DRAFT_451017 [Cantharellus anzutake]
MMPRLSKRCAAFIDALRSRLDLSNGTQTPSDGLPLFSSGSDHGDVYFSPLEPEISPRATTPVTGQYPVSPFAIYRRRQENAQKPACRIPDEILSEIFLLGFIPDHRVLVGKYLKSISSTCSRWRSASIHTPGLWSHIACDWTNARYPLDALYTFLERSVQAPLTLSIYNPDFGAPPPYHKILFEDSDLHSTRIRCLRLDGAWSVGTSFSSLPSLEALTLSVNPNEVEQDARKVQEFLDSLFRCAQPHSLRLWRCTRTYSFSGLNLKRLTRLSYVWEAVDESFVELLRNALNLEELEFDVVGAFGDFLGAYSISLPQLRCLRLGCLLPGIERTFFPRVMAESLEYLDLRDASEIPPYLSPCRFPNLRIIIAELSILDYLPAAFNSLPLLEIIHLLVRGEVPKLDWIYSLCHGLNSDSRIEPPPICPQLRTIAISLQNPSRRWDMKLSAALRHLCLVRGRQSYQGGIRVFLHMNPKDKWPSTNYFLQSSANTNISKVKELPPLYTPFRPCH